MKIVSSPKGNYQKPGVVFQPKAHQGLQKGVNLLVDAIRPTLGPQPRLVCIERVLPGKPPELLDSGGTIARRILEIQGRNADMGAMFVRHMLWKLQEKIGDGTATAAVIFQEVYNQGITYLASGGNAMRLRTFLEEGLRAILDEVEKSSAMLRGKEQLARYAETVCHDVELAEALGEIFDILGPYGRLEIRSGRRREITREYVQGSYWDEGLLSPNLVINARQGRSVVEEGGVLATDLEIEDPEDIVRVMELALEAGLGGVLLVAKSISDQALGVIRTQANWQKVKVLAVKTPGNFYDAYLPNLNDLAVLTGGRMVLQATHTRLANATLEDFGAARKIWATRETFGIITGKGDPRQVRQYVEDLQLAYRRCDKVDDQEKLGLRIGRVLGGSATLWIGAISEGDYEARKELAMRTGRAIRNARLDGVVPGCGCTLLACQPALLERMQRAADPDERAAFRILARAVEEPFRTLMANAGYASGEIHSLLGKAGFRQGFDLRTRALAEPGEAGLLDAAGVVREAAHSAISSAALLLTTDVLVHLKNPPQQYNA
jgi:chaperonin GroEL